MDRTALLGLIICSLVIFLYFIVFLPWFFPPTPRPPEPARESPTVKAPLPPEERSQISVSLESLPPSGVELVDNIVLENDLLKTTWTNEGAAVKDVILKKFKDYRGQEKLCLIRPFEACPLPLAIQEVLGRYDLSRHRYQLKEVSPRRVSFQTTLADSLRLTKVVSLQDGRYNVEVEIILENISQHDLSVNYAIVTASQMCPEGTPEYDMASVVGVDVGGGRTKLIQKTLGELLKSPERNESHGIAWAGGMNKYFATVLKTQPGEPVSAVDSRPVTEENTPKKANLWVTLHTAKLSLPPQGSDRHSYVYFIGPKREDILREYNLEGLLGFGAFTPISKGLLAILNAFYGVIPNYGVAIIILTFFVKAALFPLTRKSQLSMYQMQKLQPLMEQIREKHKKDKQRMAQEQVELFKKHGVNPMSGCLPILLQLPVFYALFRTLQLAFEMRQAPFALWIKDLSQPDTMLILPFWLPFLGNTLNALPIIMAVASIIQMRTMPKTQDPRAQQQQRLMRWMPIFFVFILYHMPSGLVLYWTVSTILSIGEQILIKRMIARIK